MEAICRSLRAEYQSDGSWELYLKSFGAIFPDKDVETATLQPEEMHLLLIQLKADDWPSRASAEYLVIMRDLRKDIRMEKLCDSIAELTKVMARVHLPGDSHSVASEPAVKNLDQCAKTSAENALVIPANDSVSTIADVPLRNSISYNDWYAENKDDVKKWSSDQGLVGIAALPYLAIRGDLNTLKAAIQVDNKYVIGFAQVAAYAAAGNHIHVLEWINAQHYVKSMTTQEKAAEYGHLDALIWLDQHGYPRSIAAATYAAANGHANIIKWMVSRGYPIATTKYAVAISRGHLEVLKALGDHLIKDCDLLDNAAKYGQIDIINWALAFDLTWTADTTTIAAKNDRLDVIKYVVENHLPVDENVCENSAFCNNVDLFKYAIRMNFPRGHAEKMCAGELKEWLSQYDALFA